MPEQSPSSAVPWYLTDLILALLITFLTYLVTQVLVVPFTKWRKIKDEIIVVLIQYANYQAHSYTTKEGTRKFEDRGLYNTVEQDLRKLAGKVSVLQNYFFYKFWKFFGLLLTEKKIASIRRDLIGWANCLIEKDLKYDSNRDFMIESLRKNLGLPNNFALTKEIRDLELKRSERQ